MFGVARQDERFAAIYRSHFDAVSRYCLRRLPIEDARDATTDVFETAWRRLDSVADSDDILPWLYGVARNAIRNRSRSSRRSLRLVTKLSTQPTALAADPAEQVLLSEPGRSVDQAMGQLSESDREIIRLRAFEDLSVEQVSLVLGCSADAAKKRCSRAMQRLRAALESLGIPEPIPRAIRKEGTS